jgi:hypothetical protein
MRETPLIAVEVAKVALRQEPWQCWAKRTTHAIVKRSPRQPGWRNEDNVIDGRPIHVDAADQQRSDRDRRKIAGANRRKSAGIGTDWGSDGVADKCFLHGITPLAALLGGLRRPGSMSGHVGVALRDKRAPCLHAAAQEL